MSLSPRTTYESGATVLGRHSHQQFSSMSRFRDDEIDWDNKTEIIIRIVAKKERPIIRYPFPREYIAVKERSPPIPPRIDSY